MSKGKSWLPTALFAAFLVLVIAAGIAGAMIASRDPQTHAHGAVDKLLWQPVEAYDFKLVGPDGKPVRLSQFRGKTVIFAFGFTNCPNICPATLSHFAAIRKALPDSVRDKVQFLFVSVDPDRDNSTRLAEYVPFFDQSFMGLTGSPNELQATAYKYKASFTKKSATNGDPENYFMDHSADAYIIAPDGKWVMSYPFEKLGETGEIAKDLTKVATKGSL